MDKTCCTTSTIHKLSIIQVRRAPVTKIQGSVENDLLSQSSDNKFSDQPVNLRKRCVRTIMPATQILQCRAPAFGSLEQLLNVSTRQTMPTAEGVECKWARLRMVIT